MGVVLVTAGLFTGATAIAAPQAAPYPVDLDPVAPVVTDDATDNPTDTPTDEPVTPPTDEPTDPPTEEPTDPPTEEPTDPPTEEPTDPPTEEPTDPPTEEPTDPPTEEPTEEPTVPPSSNPDPTFPENPFPSQSPVNQAPRISSIPPITAVSRADLTEADLLRGITVLDDVDHYLVPEVTNWGDWNNPVECPGGYPCVYRLVFTVFDSHGNYDDATRDIIITGQPTSTLRSVISAASNNLIDRGVFEPNETLSVADEWELPYTGVDSEQLLGISGLLIASGIGAMAWGRKRAIR
ncbi:LPXTG cell wall anchor domain-containing protein [Flaviflexus massiliensis]|uniref:LPXTG cell wall anchor domain-containing protein n=1 Tax=Flaviflexus massiliensis TaxID=1522309 RepID=UPI000AE38F36|nr:LPXTG cell wall anchor domain-containing protein [Flaviflexus massiliensis]